MLFDTLKARGVSEFIDFLHMLRETSHGWLADELYEMQVNAANVDQPGVSTSVTLKEFINNLEENAEKNRKNRSGEYHYPFGYLMYPGIPFVYPVPGSMLAGQAERGNRNSFQAYMPRKHNDRQPPVGYPDDMPRLENQPSLENASKQLRSLGELYEREGVSTDQSMTLLKQEELELRTLLENNVQEQQILLNKKEAISDLEERMKEINLRASLLHTEETDKLSRARLRHLKRVPFRYTHAFKGSRHEDAENS